MPAKTDGGIYATHAGLESNFASAAIGFAVLSEQTRHKVSTIANLYRHNISFDLIGINEARSVTTMLNLVPDLAMPRPNRWNKKIQRSIKQCCLHRPA
jgi:hypothetical protein